MKESTIEHKLIKAVESQGGICYKWISGEVGVPDRIAILPHGVIYFIELKKPKGGRVAPMQIYQQTKLKELGCNVKIIKNEDEIQQFIREIQDG